MAYIGGPSALLHSAFQAAQHTANTIKTEVGKFFTYCVQKISRQAVTAQNRSSLAEEFETFKSDKEMHSTTKKYINIRVSDETTQTKYTNKPESEISTIHISRFSPEIDEMRNNFEAELDGLHPKYLPKASNATHKIAEYKARFDLCRRSVNSIFNPARIISRNDLADLETRAHNHLAELKNLKMTIEWGIPKEEVEAFSEAV